MVMTSVSGHLLALEFVGSYKHWQSCNPLVLFDAPVFKYCPDNYEKIKVSVNICRMTYMYLAIIYSTV